MYTHHTQQKGFTLVETLVAVTVLLLAIVGPMVVAARGFQSAYFAREQMAAVFLAQEALEAVVQLRDDTALDVVWGTGTDTWDWFDNGPIPSQCRTGSQTCDYNALDGTFHLCSGSSCLLHENQNPLSNNILYAYGSGSDWIDSIYTREISFEEEESAQELTVTVTVTWPSNIYGQHASDASVVLQTRIFNQYE
ncbi:MAG: type II secretion system GspH family protein [Candidatus Pacebacteria bacterium]|nr:type II secretion system GspH family protein [Candidatus Paceibacterota bacterium]